MHLKLEQKEVKRNVHLQIRHGVRLCDVQSLAVHSRLTTHCVLIPRISLTSVF